MPVFTAIGAYVAGTILGLVGTAATIVGGIVAMGAAFVTSRIINGNANKGVNSAANQGGRIQVPPASNNKIPVVYGSAFVNGIITDARLVNKNNTMYYCIVLSEKCNISSATYTVDDIYWNDLRLTAVDSSSNSHKILDGRKTVDGPGEDFIDTNFVVDGKSMVEVRVYAGSTASANQIWPAPSTGNTQAGYAYWGDGDNSWTTAYEMKGLVFAIVKVNYDSNKGFTGLPNMTFKLSNSVNNPADVWFDYMTSERYGAGLPWTSLDTSANAVWQSFCQEDITYTNKDGTTNQLTDRYTINGVIDTSREVKTNIDTILQNGGAWMSYNVATGLWSPIIKKAITAGDPTDSATLFTGSISGTTLTVTDFPAGRIEAGQLLASTQGTIPTTYIVNQILPLTAGESTGQKGRYTIDRSQTLSSTNKLYTSSANLLQFNDDNIISGISLSSTRLEDLYNMVEVEFYDKYNKDQKAYSRVELSSGRNPNEPDNQLRMSLDLVNNSVQAELIGQMEMRQSRDDLVIEFTANHYGIQTQAGDVIGVTSDLYSWAPKLFRVMRVKEQETEDGGLVATIQALEYNPDCFTIEPITEFTTSNNIGIGNLISSVNLPPPDTPSITNVNSNSSVPNFTFNVVVPEIGGPFDEIQIYYTEGWDPQSVTMSVVPGTGTNGVPTGKGLMTVTSLTYNSLNVGDYFDTPAMVIESQLTQTSISTKTYASGGAIGAYTITLNNVTGIIPGQRPGGYGIQTDAQVVSVSGTIVTLNLPFIAQATGNYTFTTAGGTGTYQVSYSGTLSSASRTLTDQPLETDFKYLKNVVPSGNNGSFVGGSTVGVVITELPANSYDYRRWFLKARLGWKGHYGAFSSNGQVDLSGNVGWTPNPVAAGNLSDLKDVNITSKVEGDTLYYDANTAKWRNTHIFKVVDDLVALDINTETNSRFNMNSGLTSNPSFPLNLRHTSSGTPTVGFGVSQGFEVETTSSGIKTVGFIDYVMNNATAGHEDFTFGLGLMKDGQECTPSIPNYVLYVSSTGDIKMGGDLYLNNDADNVNALITAYSSTNTATPGQLNWNGTTWAFGNNVRFTKPISLSGSTSGLVTLNAPSVAGSQSYTLPTALPGTSGYVLSSTTGGTMSWAANPQGDVIGPSSAGDNAVVRFDTTSGKLIQNSLVTIADTTGDITTPGSVILSDTLKITGTSGGQVGFKTHPSQYSNNTYIMPWGDGTAGQLLKTDGSGNLSWTSASGGSLTLANSGTISTSGFNYSLGPGVILTGSGTTATMAVQSIRYQPIYVSEACTLTEVALSVGGTAPTSCTAMIYIDNCSPNSSTGWQPSSHLSGGYCGEITISSTGLKTITGLSISLAAGSYLIAVQTNNYTGTLTLGHYGGQVLTGNGYTINATSPTTAYSWARTGVSYTSGTPATVSNFTQQSTPSVVGNVYTVFTKFAKV